MPTSGSSWTWQPANGWSTRSEPRRTPLTYAPVGPDREPIAASVERVERGIRVTAEASTTLAWLVAGGAEYPLVAFDHEHAHSA